MPVVRDQVVWLPQLVGPENFYLEGFIFENCTVIGPAVILPVEDCGFERVEFDGSIETLFCVMPRGIQIPWVVGLRHVHFRHSRLRRIAILTTPDQLEAARAQFSLPING